MAASGYTPIITYNSGTTTNVPIAGNLANGELAINYADGKLFYKDSGGVVQVLASKSGNVNVSSFSAGTTGFTPSTATTGAVTLSGTLVTTNGGTGLSTYAAGDLPYYASGTALSKLGIGSSGQILTSTGSAPQWSTLSSVAVTSFSAGTTGFTPSTATSGAVTLSGTLATTNGGTGLTSFTANGVVYASSTSALATGSALTFDGTTLGNSRSANSSTALMTVTNSSTGNSAVAAFQNSNGTINGTFGTTGTAYSAYGVLTPSTTYLYSGALALASEGFIAFGAGSGVTEQMRLTSTGLGIGTSSPSRKLEVNGIFRQTDGTVQAEIGSGGGVAFYGTNNNYPVAIQVNAVEQARFTSAGYLGIGTSSPLAPLHVYRSGGSSIRIDTDASTSSTQLNFAIAGVNKWSLYRPNSSGDMRLFDNVNTIDVMTWQAGGNVGIGTSSPATTLDVTNSVVGIAYPLNLTNPSATNNGRGVGMKFTNGSGEIGDILGYYDGTDQTLIFTSTGTTRFSTNGNERMRIDTSGNLLVGTTSTISGNGAYGTFGNSSSSGANRWAAYFGTNSSSSNPAPNFGLSIGWNYSGGGGESNIVYGTSLGSSSGLAFASSDGTTLTERMRIDSSGNLLVGTTGTVYSTSNSIQVLSSGTALNLSTSGTSATAVRFFTSTYTLAGYISTSGTTTLYLSASDSRLKENIADAESSSNLIDEIQVRQFDWKADGSHQRYGFIAQELVTIAPEAVYKPKDPEEIMAVDYSQLVPMLVKEIQSLRARLKAANIA
jgi:hypothetical protein